MYRTGFNLCGLRVHAHDLVAFRPNGDRRDILSVEFLGQANAGSRILDQDRGLPRKLPTIINFDGLAFERGEGQALADQVEEIVEITLDAPDGPDGVIG